MILPVRVGRGYFFSRDLTLQNRRRNSIQCLVAGIFEPVDFGQRQRCVGLAPFAVAIQVGNRNAFVRVNGQLDDMEMQNVTRRQPMEMP